MEEGHVCIVYSAYSALLVPVPMWSRHLKPRQQAQNIPLEEAAQKVEQDFLASKQGEGYRLFTIVATVVWETVIVSMSEEDLLL